MSSIWAVRMVSWPGGNLRMVRDAEGFKSSVSLGLALVQSGSFRSKQRPPSNGGKSSLIRRLFLQVGSLRELSKSLDGFHLMRYPSLPPVFLRRTVPAWFHWLVCLFIKFITSVIPLLTVAYNVKTTKSGKDIQKTKLIQHRRKVKSLPLYSRRSTPHKGVHVGM